MRISKTTKPNRFPRRAFGAPGAGLFASPFPTRPEIYASIDRDFGHFRRSPRPALRARLEGAGLAIVRLKPGEVRLYDRVIFPLVHGFEARIFRPPFGQSRLAVARAK